MKDHKCVVCGDEISPFFSYYYDGDDEDEMLCEDCLADTVFSLDNLIAFIDSREDLQDEIYIEREFGVEIDRSSFPLRRLCGNATKEAWRNGRNDWKALKREICFDDFFTFCGAKRIEYFKED